MFLVVGTPAAAAAGAPAVPAAGSPVASAAPAAGALATPAGASAGWAVKSYAKETHLNIFAD